MASRAPGDDAVGLWGRCVYMGEEGECQRGHVVLVVGNRSAQHSLIRSGLLAKSLNRAGHSCGAAKLSRHTIM